MPLTIRAYEAATGYRVSNNDSSVDETGEPTLTPLDSILDEHGRQLDPSSVIADFEAGRLAAALAPVSTGARLAPSFDRHNPAHYTFNTAVRAEAALNDPEAMMIPL